MEQGDRGRELREYNEEIVRCLNELRTQRDELDFLVEKQYEERRMIESEIEKLTYKLCLVNKSLAQRIKAKSYYDKTIQDVEEHYKTIVEHSGRLQKKICQDHDELEKLMNKGTGTEGGQANGTPYTSGPSKFAFEDACVCEPVKEEVPPHIPSAPSSALRQRTTQPSQKKITTTSQTSPRDSVMKEPSMPVPQQPSVMIDPSEATIYNSGGSPQQTDSSAYNPVGIDDSSTMSMNDNRNYATNPKMHHSDIMEPKQTLQDIRVPILEIQMNADQRKYLGNLSIDMKKDIE